MKKQSIAIFFSTFLILLITGCGIQQSTTPKSDKIEVTMDIQPELTDDRTLQCNIITNLPDETKLDVFLEGSTKYVTVNNGKATASFDFIESGEYTVSIKTSHYPDHPELLNQPISVEDVIGFTGSKMTGPYVVSIGDDRYGISYSKKINAGTKEQIEAQNQIDEQERQEALQAASQKNTIANKYEPQKIVDSDGKQIWKIYINDSDLHFTGNYKGSGNFIVKLSDSNQDLVSVIANEIGDYVSDKTVYVPYEGWYYLEINTTHGSSNFSWE